MAQKAAWQPNFGLKVHQPAHSYRLIERVAPERGQYAMRAAQCAALSLLTVCAAFAFWASALQVHAAMKQERLSIVSGSGTHDFEIEVAETPRQKSLGLMFRTELSPGHGMLFPYPQPQEITMWMRNTLISLDMVFITETGKIHRIEHRTEPMSERIIASEGQVLAVLEIGGGEAARLGLAPGDTVRHHIFDKAGSAR